MPAAIDWTAAGGLAAVQTLTVALGPREAARRLRLSPAHGDALRQLCARGKWLSPEPRQVSPRAVTSHQQPVSLSPVPQPTAKTVLATLDKSCHQLVTKAPDALAEALDEMGGDTRLAGMEYAKLVTEHARDRARTEPEKALAASDKVKSALQGAAIAGSWQQQLLSVGVKVNVSSMGVD